jgi:murein L,D-transpeptidase YcbB/YkuD
VVRPSKPRKPAAPKKKKKDPTGTVTLGPLTQVITDPNTGTVTRKTDMTSLTPAELALYKQQAKKTDSLDQSDYELLTDEQWLALESESIEKAREGQPDVAAPDQHERALRAAKRARFLMSKKSVPPIPRTPANPSVAKPPVQLQKLSNEPDAPLAYVSPPTPINLDLARREAPTLAKHIRTKGANYSRQSLRDFQSHAGITVDGIYGPLSVDALRYFKVPNPPKALFKAKAGSVVTYAPAN